MPRTTKTPVHVQTYLTPSVAKRLKIRAKKQGVALAALLRTVLENATARW